MLRVTGSSFDGKTTALRVKEEALKHNFLLHFGDISYARGYGYIWEQYHLLIEPISSSLPYMVSIGNHEYCHLTGGTIYVGYILDGFYYALIPVLGLMCLIGL